MTDAGETSMQRWRVDSTPWLTAEQRQRVGDPDEAVEGATGKAAALLYGIVEVRMMYYIARLAILAGDPQHPEVLFRPRGLQCEHGRVSWHADDRFLVVYVGMSNKRLWRTDYAVAPCVFDVPHRTFTLIPLSQTHFIRLARSNDGWTVDESSNRPASVPSHAGERFADQELRWAPWEEIASRSARFFSGWFGAVR